MLPARPWVAEAVVGAEEAVVGAEEVAAAEAEAEAEATPRHLS